MSHEAEMELYRRGRYAATEASVALCMTHSDKRCAGGECDGEGTCDRHRRTPEIVSRLERLRDHVASLRKGEKHHHVNDTRPPWRP